MADDVLDELSDGAISVLGLVCGFQRMRGLIVTLLHTLSVNVNTVKTWHIPGKNVRTPHEGCHHSHSPSKTCK